MTAPAARRTGVRAWSILLLGSLLLVGGLEAALLETGVGFFSSGFGGAKLVDAGQVVAFVLLSTVCDAALLLACWALVLPLLRWLRAGPVQSYCLTGFVALCIPLSLDLARRMLDVVLGGVTALAALWDLSGRSLIEMGAQALQGAPALGVFLFSLLVGSTLVLLLTRALERRLRRRAQAFAAPPVRRLLLGSLGCVLVATAVLAAPLPQLDDVRFGLLRKPSGLFLYALADRLTDVDFDGSGALAQPRDPAPLDRRIHPFALELPGDGSDQNGIGGDLPAGFQPVGVVEAALPAPPRKPLVLLLVFLETFRGDLVGARLDGCEIMPFLDRLAREGGHSEHAYVHTPITYRSRAQLFGGTLTPHAGQSTLIDDFKALGFQVGYFSGQNDAFADSELTVGADRADVFYDARQDREHHVGRGTSVAALQVSWKRLLGRVDEFLAQRDPSRSLFLYVNIVDTHFPYHHEQLDDILGVAPIGRHAIRASARDAVWRTYANSAANVDRAIERLVATVQQHSAGRAPALVVTADHGEAVFDRGMLGHGQSLDALETRVPFVVWGIGGEWPDPVGPADLRGLLRRNLMLGRDDGNVARPRFTSDPERRIMQYVAQLQDPRRIALRGSSDVWIYDIGRDRLERLDSSDRPLPPDPAAEQRARLAVVHNWEALQLRDAQRDQGRARRSK